MSEQLDVFLRQVLVAGKFLVVVAPVAAFLIVCGSKHNSTLTQIWRQHVVQRRPVTGCYNGVMIMDVTVSLILWHRNDKGVENVIVLHNV